MTSYRIDDTPYPAPLIRSDLCHNMNIIIDARISAGWTLIFIALLYTTAPAVGSMVRLNIINTVYPQGLDQPALAYEARLEWMKNWETTGLLKYEDKNSDDLIQYYNDKNEEYATTVTAEKGWQGNELAVNNDILVLANPEIANLLLKTHQLNRCNCWHDCRFERNMYLCIFIHGLVLHSKHQQF